MWTEYIGNYNATNVYNGYIIIFINKRIQNSAISSTAANRIVARLYT